MLRWNAFFKEAVTESLAENFRVRKCVIYMYLEDESIYVAEPKQHNSGIPQGVFLKRHKIPKNDVGDFYTRADVRVADTLTLYGRTFYVVSCDAFTRGFLTDQGFEVNEDVGFPDDPIDAYRETMKKDSKIPYPPPPRDDDLSRYIEAAAGAPSNALAADKLNKFLAHDRKVLRFFCVWDDREALFGENRPFVLHYYLSDDTVEVLEVAEPNSGSDPFPVFLRRGPLPNQKLEVDALGPTKTFSYYTFEDLKVGGHVRVYNRDFYIHDADNFTKAWYITNAGRTEADFPPISVEEEQMPIPQMAVPPYNGFGGHADSLQNCIALIPKPVKPDFEKQMTYAHTILRFKAKIVPDATHAVSDWDSDREFILSVYLANDTIAIYENPDRKKNIAGGKFLERQEVRKPNSSEAFVATDFYVGATVVVLRRSFELVEADSYTYAFMEEHPESFPRSDPEAVGGRLTAASAGREAALREALTGAEDSNGEVELADVANAFKSAGVECVAQEIITLGRKHAGSGAGKVSVSALLEAVSVGFALPAGEGEGQ